jgi:hypothetical protein
MIRRIAALVVPWITLFTVSTVMLAQMPPFDKDRLAPARPTAGAWDVNKAVKFLQDHASKPSDSCAHYTSNAIDAGFGAKVVQRPALAKDFGPALVKAGFHEYSSNEIKFGDWKKGDLVVFQAIGEHRKGHMAMFDGTRWISDFRQLNFYVLKDGSKPTYKIYRYDESNRRPAPNPPGGGGGSSTSALRSGVIAGGAAARPGGVLISPAPEKDAAPAKNDDRQQVDKKRAKNPNAPVYELDEQ